jgi:hypothetical protein
MPCRNDSRKILLVGQVTPRAYPALAIKLSYAVLSPNSVVPRGFFFATVVSEEQEAASSIRKRKAILSGSLILIEHLLGSKKKAETPS